MSATSISPGINSSIGSRTGNSLSRWRGGNTSDNISALSFCGQLPARGIDVSAARLPDICGDPAGLEYFLKSVHTFRRRCIVIKPLRTVVRDKIYLDSRQLITVEQ